MVSGFGLLSEKQIIIELELKTIQNNLHEYCQVHFN